MLEDDHAVCRVVDYIHLNPVRAKVISIKKVGDFRLSRLSRLTQKTGIRGLDSRVWMEALGLKKTVNGGRKYIRHLGEVCGTDEDGVVRNTWGGGLSSVAAQFGEIVWGKDRLCSADPRAA